MADYLYHTSLFTDTSKVIGFNPNNDTWLADFDSNHSDDVQAVTDVTIAATTFLFDMEYPDFEALIADPVEWIDVKCYTAGNRHILYIISNTALE